MDTKIVSLGKASTETKGNQAPFNDPGGTGTTAHQL